MFAVFGVSLVKAREKANKLVPSHDKLTKRQYTLEEFSSLLDAETKKVYESAKPAKMSDIFPSIEIAKQYMDGVESDGTGRNMTIKKRVCRMNPDGTPMTDPKTRS